MSRIVTPEILDHLPPDDPRATRSRGDLHRVNFFMGNHAIMAKALRAHCAVPPKNIAEIGAGDGRFLLRVAEESAWENVDAVLLDRQNSISVETLAAFSRFDWRPKAVVAEVFDWNDQADVIIANLFIHHFADPKLRELLERLAAQARLFIALEPHRFYYPFPCALTTLLIGCSWLTVHDAEASIRGGFVRREISELWPEKGGWHLTERRAGLFSHLFVAKRI
jgi:2-polyprenyl-3-methyl-5-hydroxy-6-metoxy-1,4-benzoquinol methylase